MSKKQHADYVDQIEQIVRELGRPYVAVDDAKKAIFSGAQIDSFDLLVYMADGDHLLATVLPPSRRKPTAEQASALRQWERVFGSGFAGVFIHATDEPTAWRLDEDPPRPVPLRTFLGADATAALAPPAPPPEAPPAEPEPGPLSPTCVDGQAVFDVGCVHRGTQLSLF
jgi:hypothetical protein